MKKLSLTIVFTNGSHTYLRDYENIILNIVRHIKEDHFVECIKGCWVNTDHIIQYEISD